MEQTALEADWFLEGTYPGDLSLLSSATVYSNGTVGFTPEEESISALTVYEAYYTDGNAKYQEYVLQKESGFHLSLTARYQTGEQYGLYRIPFENGEYIFYITYQ